MKIQDVEKRLGISKANIRFYERQGLLLPERSPNGYREYTEEDVSHLKEIIILRKLGIPVQQISAVLNDRFPLQQALADTVSALLVQTEQANAALSLCRQLQQEGAQTLDVERYWSILQQHQEQGDLFNALAEDYFNFVEEYQQSPREFAKKIRANKRTFLVLILLGGLFCGYIFWAGGFEQIQHLGFQLSLHRILTYLIGICMIPAFLAGRKNPAYRKWASIGIRILLAGGILLLWMQNTFT